MINIQQTPAPIVDRSLFFPGRRVGVLLIHGLGGTPVELRHLSLALARAGHTVSAIQLAGHGGTADDLRRSTRSQWMASADTALTQLQARCDIVIAGGLSMGAILALNLAQRHPGAMHALMLLAPAFKLDGWSMPWTSGLLNAVKPWMLPFDANLAEHPPHGLKDERVRAFIVGAMHTGVAGEAGTFTTPLRAFAEFNALASETKAQLQTLTQPALVIHPRDDDMAHMRNACYLQEHLGGLVETVILNDSYHLVTLDRQRHIVVDRAVEFVNRVSGMAHVASGIGRLPNLGRRGNAGSIMMFAQFNKSNL